MLPVRLHRNLFDILLPSLTHYYFGGGQCHKLKNGKKSQWSYRTKIQQDVLGNVNRVKEIRREKGGLKITDNSIMWGRKCIFLHIVSGFFAMSLSFVVRGIKAFFCVQDIPTCLLSIPPVLIDQIFLTSLLPSLTHYYFLVYLVWFLCYVLRNKNLFFLSRIYRHA